MEEITTGTNESWKRSSYQEGEDWDPINWLNPATFVCLSLARTSISNIICHISLFFVQRFMVRNDSSISWYWWNYWLALSCHNRYVGISWEVIVCFIDIGYTKRHAGFIITVMIVTVIKCVQYLLIKRDINISVYFLLQFLSDLNYQDMWTSPHHSASFILWKESLSSDAQQFHQYQ
jgi:hypothetical protein